uniref:PIN domain-containing protein n=1 Tax=termite gut metagenome TaxID=433724 RepID=S0DGL8_9ZZZZ
MDKVLLVNAACCRHALNGTEPDFEDGIVRAVVEISRVDYLVSRDQRAFTGSLIPHISPVDALHELRRFPAD